MRRASARSATVIRTGKIIDIKATSSTRRKILLSVPAGAHDPACLSATAMKRSSRHPALSRQGPQPQESTTDVARRLRYAVSKAGLIVRDQRPSPGVIVNRAAATRTHDAVFELPFVAHATMEPMNATVHVQEHRVELTASVVSHRCRR
jgi:hypothetical protein